MRAEFKKIGPINEADLELKDLTIIAGANNTGKTYLAYTLYGFLKLVKEPLFLYSRVKKLPFDSGKVSKELVADGKSKVNIDIDCFIEKSNEVATQALSISSNMISNIFSSPPDKFKAAQFSLNTDDYTYEKGTGSLEFERRFELKIGGKKSSDESDKFRLNGNYENNTLSFELRNYKSAPPRQVIEDIVEGTFIGLCVPELPDPFILSAERFGISLFYKELDFTKNRIVEILQKLKDQGDTDPFYLLMDQASARYAQPIKDNIDYTRDLEFIQTKRSELFQKGLYNDIKDILSGYFKAQNGEIRFISKARKKGKFDIPLHLASSSARGLSDFYFFLKHIARENQLLIIDEPESHLNTANQIEMARLIARCVNSGLKVLITTHSDYLIKEFNNLIMLGREFPNKENLLKKYSSTYGSNDYLNANSVAGFICEKGSLTKCEVDSLGLNMPNFDDTIDKINTISNELALHVGQS